MLEIGLCDWLIGELANLPGSQQGTEANFAAARAGSGRAANVPWYAFVDLFLAARVQMCPGWAVPAGSVGR
jgi:hypothetical protein